MHGSCKNDFNFNFRMISTLPELLLAKSKEFFLRLVATDSCQLKLMTCNLIVDSYVQFTSTLYMYILVRSYVEFE